MEIIVLADYIEDALISFFSKNKSLLICTIPNFKDTREGIKLVNEIKMALGYSSEVCDIDNYSHKLIRKCGFYYDESENDKINFNDLINKVNFIFIINNCTSTMDIAKSIYPFLIRYDLSIAIISNSQSAGRGRDGRVWVSSPGNIHISICYPNIQKTKLQLSLKISDFVKETLSLIFSTDNINVKWPNDIFLKNNKIGGVLIDIEDNRLCIGIGVNLAGNPSFKGICDLLNISNWDNSRLLVIKCLIKQISEYMQQGMDEETTINVVFSKSDVICILENDYIRLNLIDICNQTLMPVGIDDNGNKFRIMCNEWILKDNCVAHKIQECN